MQRPTSVLLAILTAAIVTIVTIVVIFVQGDDTPALVERLPTLTPTPTLDPLGAGTFFLEIINPPQDEIVVDSPSLTLRGRTRADAVVSIDDLIVEPDVDGIFTTTVTLSEGPNIIEIVASVASAEPLDRVLAIIYAP